MMEVNQEGVEEETLPKENFENESFHYGDDEAADDELLLSSEDHIAPNRDVHRIIDKKRTQLSNSPALATISEERTNIDNSFQSGQNESIGWSPKFGESWNKENVTTQATNNESFCATNDPNALFEQHAAELENSARGNFIENDPRFNQHHSPGYKEHSWEPSVQGYDDNQSHNSLPDETPRKRPLLGRQIAGRTSSFSGDHDVRALMNSSVEPERTSSIPNRNELDSSRRQETGLMDPFSFSLDEPDPNYERAAPLRPKAVDRLVSTGTGTLNYSPVRTNGQALQSTSTPIAKSSVLGRAPLLPVLDISQINKESPESAAGQVKIMQTSYASMMEEADSQNDLSRANITNDSVRSVDDSALARVFQTIEMDPKLDPNQAIGMIKRCKSSNINRQILQPPSVHRREWHGDECTSDVQTVCNKARNQTVVHSSAPRQPPSMDSENELTAIKCKESTTSIDHTQHSNGHTMGQTVSDRDRHSMTHSSRTPSSTCSRPPSSAFAQHVELKSLDIPSMPLHFGFIDVEMSCELSLPIKNNMMHSLIVSLEIPKSTSTLYSKEGLDGFSFSTGDLKQSIRVDPNSTVDVKIRFRPQKIARYQKNVSIKVDGHQSFTAEVHGYGGRANVIVEQDNKTVWMLRDGNYVLQTPEAHDIISFNVINRGCRAAYCMTTVSHSVLRVDGNYFVAPSPHIILEPKKKATITVNFKDIKALLSDHRRSSNWSNSTQSNDLLSLSIIWGHEAMRQRLKILSGLHRDFNVNVDGISYVRPSFLGERLIKGTENMQVTYFEKKFFKKDICFRNIHVVSTRQALMADLDETVDGVVETLEPTLDRTLVPDAEGCFSILEEQQTMNTTAQFK